MRWWRWPVTTGPSTGMTPHWAPPAPHGATFSTRPGRAAAREVAAKTTVLAALRTGVHVAVVVGYRHDDGLVDHIGGIGVTLTQVGHVTSVEAGVLDAVVGGLELFCRVGGGNVVGQRDVVEVDRHRFPRLLVVVGSSERSRAFSDLSSLLSDSSSLVRCSRCKIWAIPAMLMPCATSSLMRCRRSRSSSLYRRVPPSVRAGVSSPRRSYRRSACGSIPDNSAATEMPYTPRADRAKKSSGTELLHSPRTTPKIILAQTWL